MRAMGHACGGTYTVAVSEWPGYPGRGQAAYGWRKIWSLPLTVEL